MGYFDGSNSIGNAGFEPPVNGSALTFDGGF